MRNKGMTMRGSHYLHIKDVISAFEWVIETNELRLHAFVEISSRMCQITLPRPWFCFSPLCSGFPGRY